MPPLSDTAFIVFDTESVVDGSLLGRVLYPGETLSPGEAIRLEGMEESPGENVRSRLRALPSRLRVGTDLRLLTSPPLMLLATTRGP
jgi:hypothetical protein